MLPNLTTISFTLLICSIFIDSNSEISCVISEDCKAERNFSLEISFHLIIIIIIIIIIKNNIIIIIRTFPECFAPEKFQCKIT